MQVAETKRNPVRSSLVASAGDVPMANGAQIPFTGGTSNDASMAWQKEAWDLFDCVGELRYVCAWMQNALSRCQLMASRINVETGQPTGECDDSVVRQLVADIAGGPAGQARLLGQLATFLTVPGEGYVAILVIDGKEQWHVLSKEEVHKTTSGKVTIDLPSGESHEVDDDADTLTRVYRPHPRFSAQADTPVRAALPVLREIVRLGQHVEATAKSRLAGNGVFAIPNEMSLPKSNAPAAASIDRDAPGLPPINPGGEDPGVPTQALSELEADWGTVGVSFTKQASPTKVMEAMIEAGSTAIQNPDSASAVFPLVMQGPGEWLDKMKHITFSTEFTETVIRLRDSAMKRLATTLDIPAEILLGLGDSNHWSAWQIEDSAIKMHVEPLLTIIVDAVTRNILRPLMELKGREDADQFVVWFSTANLAQRPDRTNDAKDGYDRRVVSAEQYRKELGYDDTVAMKPPATDQERFQLALQLMEKDPRWSSVVAKLAGVDLPNVTPPQAAPGTSPVDSGGDSTDSTTPIPDTQDDARAAATVSRLRG